MPRSGNRRVTRNRSNSIPNPLAFWALRKRGFSSESNYCGRMYIMQKWRGERKVYPGILIDFILGSPLDLSSNRTTTSSFITSPQILTRNQRKKQYSRGHAARASTCLTPFSSIITRLTSKHPYNPKPTSSISISHRLSENSHLLFIRPAARRLRLLPNTTDSSLRATPGMHVSVVSSSSRFSF